MRAIIIITLLMFALLSACASDDAPQGVMGPPYNVPVDPETATNEPTQEACIRVFCDKYPEYAFDPKYCCIGGYGKGDKD